MTEISYDPTTPLPTTAAITDYKAAMAAVKAAQDEGQRIAKQAFHDGAKLLFQKHGDLIAQVSWRQYTPYFCDGDPCEFGVGDPTVLSKREVEAITADAEDEWEVSDALNTLRDEESSEDFSYYGGKAQPTTGWGENEKPNPDYVPEYGAALAAVKEFVSIWDENTLKGLFGDHATVILTAEGVDVEEYDHE